MAYALYPGRPYVAYAYKQNHYCEVFVPTAKEALDWVTECVGQLAEYYGDTSLCDVGIYDEGRNWCLLSVPGFV